MKCFQVISMCVVAVFSTGAIAAKYNLDQSHAEIGFGVKHLMISTVKGRFNKFEGGFDYDAAKKEVNNIDVKIDVSSIDTNDKKRDEHLSSPDFFDAKNHPTLTFKGEKITNVTSGKTFKVPGTLTIKGVSKPIVLNAKFEGAMTDPMQNERVVFSANADINRNDYGVSWNKKLDKGGVVVGDEVKIQIEAEAVKAK